MFLQVINVIFIAELFYTIESLLGPFMIKNNILLYNRHITTFARRCILDLCFTLVAEPDVNILLSKSIKY